MYGLSNSFIQYSLLFIFLNTLSLLSGINELSNTGFEFISHSLLASPLSRELGTTGQGLQGGALLITGVKVSNSINYSDIYLNIASHNTDISTNVGRFIRKQSNQVTECCFVHYVTYALLFCLYRGVERALCPEPCAGKLEKILMHMWKWWTAKIYKVDIYSMNMHCIEEE